MPSITPHPDGNIPAGDNPYHHDTFNVGADLGTLLMDNCIAENTVEILSYGTWNKETRQFQLVDRETGERWVVTL